jgi:hypothetical protein
MFGVAIFLIELTPSHFTLFSRLSATGNGTPRIRGLALAPIDEVIQVVTELIFGIGRKPVDDYQHMTAFKLSSRETY